MPTADGKLELRYVNFKEPTALLRLVADDLPDTFSMTRHLQNQSLRHASNQLQHK